MKIPEHMDSTDMCPDMASDEEIRAAVRDWLDEHGADIDAGDFFEGIDPAGPFRYCGSFDLWDGIWFMVRSDPRLVADVIRDWVRDFGPMDPRKGPNQ